MLLELVLVCAPLAAVVPLVAGLRTTGVGGTPAGLLQRRLYRSLLVAEKLPPATVGARQLARDIDRQTLRLAYLTQYPHRAREVRDVALLGVAVLAVTTGYYVAWWRDAALAVLVTLLALVVVAALWLGRAARNMARNDALCSELFAHFGAPADLLRPDTELVAKTPALTVAEVLDRAADVPDGGHARDGTGIATVQAVNAVLSGMRRHGAWRDELRALRRRTTGADYRALAASAAAWTLSTAGRGVDWLLGPLFAVRMAVLDDRERHRIAAAQRRGDVYKAAWLATYYRSERDRLAGHRTRLHGTREALRRAAQMR